jgi:hypothetical protein
VIKFEGAEINGLAINAFASEPDKADIFLCTSVFRHQGDLECTWSFLLIPDD